MNLSIILPAFNEESVIAQSLEAHFHWLPPDGLSLNEVIVVDDGSHDRTGDIVAMLAESHSTVKLISQPANFGKGAALKKGIACATGDIIGCVDADLAYPPDLYPFFIQPLMTGLADVTIGNRYHACKHVLTEYPLMRRWASRWFKRFIRQLHLPNFSDTQCGIKFFTRSAGSFLFQHLEQPGYLFDLEILSFAVALQLVVLEIPVNIQLHTVSNIKLHRQILPVARDMIKMLRRPSAIKNNSQLRDEWTALSSAQAQSERPFIRTHSKKSV